MNKGLGFTLVEMIVIIAIIGILAINVTPLWQGTGISLVSQANELAADIRYTQALSMSRNQRFRFVITSSNSYRILNAAGTAMILTNGATTSTLDANTVFGTVTNLPSSLIAFDNLGVPYVNATLPGTALAAVASIALTQNNQTRTVVVSPNTGRVAVQ